MDCCLSEYISNQLSCIKLRKCSEQLKKGMSQNRELYPKDRDGRGLFMEDRRESLKLEDTEAKRANKVIWVFYYREDKTFEVA